MADRPGRRRLPIPLSNRRSAQITKKNIQGTVKNAKYAGPEYVGSLPCWITYYLENDTMEIIQAPENGTAKYNKLSIFRIP
jgi:hypothetical protein